MEKQRSVNSLFYKGKQKGKIIENAVNVKIERAQRSIEDNADILNDFVDKSNPHSFSDFQRALRSINCQYSCLANNEVTQENIIWLRVSNAKTIISSGLIEVLQLLLPKLFDCMPHFDGTKEVEKTLNKAIKNIMFIFLNYSKIYPSFGVELCKRDTLLVLYYDILTKTKEACIRSKLSKCFQKIVPTIISTLYNTTLYNKQANLEKIRGMKYIDIIKDFLNCKIENIRIASLLFTAYVANDTESILIRTEKPSIKYLLNLLSESMKAESNSAKGLSSDELTMGNQKCFDSKNAIVTENRADGPIVISYCHQDQEIVMQIFEGLKKRGYKIWTDEQNMSDTEKLIESMAIGVENAAAVIICVSSDYKKNVMCLNEVHYAVRIQKTLIPLMVQSDCNPGGWLGKITSGLQYCNFTEKYTFSDAMDELCKELNKVSRPNLSNPMKSGSNREKGHSIDELAMGIYKLSKNDENKELLVDNGVLNILKKLTRRDSINCKEISLSTLRNLAFDDRHLEVINKIFSSTIGEMKSYLSLPGNDTLRTYSSTYNPFIENFKDPIAIANDIPYNMAYVNDGMMSMIPVLEDENRRSFWDDVNTYLPSPNARCSQLLDGLTRSLSRNENSSGSKKQDSIVTANGHIMISYCRENKDIVMKIYKTLEEKGYKLWIDEQNMADTENMMESMAKGVENAAAVIICVSIGYKDSLICRKEAQYAVKNKKPIIPLMVQSDYRPDGWLGFIITDLKYCNFAGKKSFMDAMGELYQQLYRIFITNQHNMNTKYQVKEDEFDHSEISNWSSRKVKDWFNEIGIKEINWQPHHTGRDLLLLKKLSNRSLLTFFQLCETQLGITEFKELRIIFENIQKI